MDDRPGQAREANEAAFVSRAIAHLREAHHDVTHAVMRLHAARSEARHVIAERENSEYKRTREACEHLKGELDECTVEDAVGEGAARYERERDG